MVKNELYPVVKNKGCSDIAERYINQFRTTPRCGNNVSRKEAIMARTRKNIATATDNVTNNVTTNNTMRGENTMNINTEATVVTLTNGNNTVDFVQFHEGSVMYIVNKIPTMLPTDIAVATIKQYINDGWKKIVKSIGDEKLYAPEEPEKTPEEIAEEKKAKREKYLTEKYGNLDTRRAYAVRHSEIWDEEKAKIAEDVKNGTRKRLSKFEWKKEMNENVDKRMVEEGFTLVR